MTQKRIQGSASHDDRFKFEVEATSYAQFKTFGFTNTRSLDQMMLSFLIFFFSLTSLSSLSSL